MDKIVVVTGNPGKLREIQMLAEGKLEFEVVELDLKEIQSLNLQEIVKDKLLRAYTEVKKPVIVEDVSAGLTSLNGLPGPFFKFFFKALGPEALWRLAAEKPDEEVVITCLAGYFDGQNYLFGEGVLQGTVVEPRGENGFGFDPVVVPDGETRTMAEMTPEEKNKISHRAKAFEALLDQIV